MKMRPKSIHRESRRVLRVRDRTPGEPVYMGMWVDDEPQVTVTRDGETIALAAPETGTATHRFAWGFRGPACANLAQAILADYLREKANGEERARTLREEFHACVVAGLPGAWALSGEQIAEFLTITEL